MRLICPNCGAQYEVGGGVVPDGGRDVQCSNCGHTWFQRPEQQDTELADELGTENVIDQNQALDAEPEVQEPSAEAETPAVDDGEPEQPVRRELDSGVTDILREEAERETAARVEESGSLETQTEMGLDQGQDHGADVKERMARLRGMPNEDLGVVAAAAAAANGARKDLLPDIEEINSTLAASTDREGDETAEEYKERRQRSGFRRGFALTLLLFVILALIYIYAPKIVEAYPQAESILTSYVDWVNTLRVWMDGAMKSAVEKLTALLSQLTGGDQA